MVQKVLCQKCGDVGYVNEKSSIPHMKNIHRERSCPDAVFEVVE